MKLFPYLKMHGNARSAINRYKTIFNGTIQRLSEYKDSPLANETNGDLIIHSEIHFGENIICLADMVSKEESDTVKLKSSDQIYELCLNFESDQLNEAERIFQELSQNGQVLMKFEKTFWQAYYGKVKDPFGIIWSLNCDQKEEKGQEKAEQKVQQKGQEQKESEKQVENHKIE